MGLADQVRVVKRFAASDVDADCESDRGGIPSGAADAGGGDTGDAREPWGRCARSRGDMCCSATEETEGSKWSCSWVVARYFKRTPPVRA